jgi:choline-sulfatase
MKFSRRSFLAAPAFLRAASVSRPHVLLLMADQFRADTLGAAGHPAVRTPHLDRLAREGAQFRSAYSSTPTCTPARAALLTGLSPWRHGMLGYSKLAEKYPFEMPRAMHERGYYTFVIGKCHYAPQRNLHGFDGALLDESGRAQSPEFRSDYRAWFASMAPNLDPDATGIGWNDHRAAEYALPEELHPTRWMGDTASRFIGTYQRPQPFFLKVSFARPHSPYDPPARLMRAYADAPIPEARVGQWAARYAPRSDGGDALWHGRLDAAIVRRSRQGYLGSVSFVDEQIGRILEALEKRGWLEETLILFTADHGDMTGDHHLWRKSYAYEASARIPMLMRWPRGLSSAPRGQTLAHPAELRDILPTCLDAAGRPQEGLDGRSLLDAAAGKPGWRETIDLEHNVCYAPENHWNALTDGRVKYVYHAMRGEEQLFDLAADPAELRDLAPEPAHEATLRSWRARMVAHLEVRGDAWVKNGRLQPRPRSMPFSPNYPQPA